MNKFVPTTFSKIGLFAILITLLSYSESRAQCMVDWEYTRSVTLDNTTNPSPLSNFQVQVTIATDALIAANKMNPDGSDIRFTDVSCNNLDYWIESGINTASTVIWIEVNSIPANGTATVNMYYGNTLATAVSDAAATFSFWEGFDAAGTNFNYLCGAVNDSSLSGSNINLAWTSSGLIGSNQSFDFNEIYTADAMVNSISGAWPGIYWAKESSQESYGLLANASAADSRISFQGPSFGWCAGHNWASSVISYTNPVGIWSLTWRGTGDLTAEFPSIGTITTNNSFNSKDENLRLLIGGIASGSGSMNLDWIRVRKYTDIEPTPSVSFEAVNYRITSGVSKLAYCPQEVFDVTYTAEGIYLPGNEFIAQLSDSSGSFASPVELGRVTSQTSGTISATIPINQIDGSAYRIRVVSNNPATIVIFDNGSDLTIHPIITADFTTTLSCLSDPTAFIDLSTIVSGSISAYEYQLGNGSLTNLGDFTYTYPSAGTYDVTLTVTSDLGCVDDTTKTVVVYDKPSAGFTSNDNCLGLASAFTNTSTGATNYAWKFGDGDTSSNTNPTHTYTQSGTYNVQLIASNADGCTDTLTQSINVYINPIAAFTYQSNCVNDTVQFTSNSTYNGFGTLTYDWEFGNGNTDTVVNPFNIYSSDSSYLTQLIVTTDLGCADTTFMSVSAYPSPMVNFVPDTVCLGETVSFDNQSTISSGSLSYTWSFGDGSTSTNVQATHTYSAIGNYEVILEAESNNGCFDSDTQYVLIYEQPVALFQVSNNCDEDSSFFVNQSIGTNLSYSWDFGDGNTDTSANPVYVYDTSGIYTVTLSIDNGNCSDVYQSTFTIYPKPSASFESEDVCLDQAVQFTNTSSLSSGTSNYNWFFGDSTMSTDINPTHLYDTAGIYEVTLVQTSDLGCVDSFSLTHIVYPIPNAEFSLGNSCYGDTVDFTNLSSIDFGTMTYVWDFSDGITDTATNPRHTFNALGIYDITLDVTSDFGCEAQKVKDITIYPVPFANFTFDNTCEEKTVSFTNLSTLSAGTMSYNWNFGGGVSAQDKNPDHVFNGFGEFSVELSVISGLGCTDTLRDTVEIYALPDVDFTVDPVCFGETSNFVNTTSVPDSSSVTGYFWKFGDQEVSFSNNPTHTYDTPGSYDVLLEATTINGCIDTVVKTAIVYQLPDPTINPLGPTSFCDGDSVELSASPLPAGYNWSTGEDSQNIIVKEDGNYQLTVTSGFGCTDTSSIDITVWELPEVVAYKDTTISKGYSVYLSATGAVFYEWTPEFDLESPSSPETKATPLDSTRFIVTGTDLNGCVNTDSVTVLVLEDYKVEATNVITPNGDGVNDFWEIINVETYPDVEVKIYNRYGNEMYSSQQYQNDWDGRYEGNDLPEGTYYFTITFEGSDKIYKGAVSILR